MIPAKKRAPPLEGGNSTKIGDMWNLNHDIRSPKFYEILIKIELKGDTSMDIKNFYNNINMCLNVVTRIIEDLLTAYQFVKRHSDFEEYFVPDRDHPYYSCNAHTYTSLGKSLLVTLTNDTYVKYSMANQAYNIVNTHSHEISVRKILSRLLHYCTPHIGGINCDVQYNLATLVFNNG